MFEVPYPQGSPEWLECRKGIPTGSEFGKFASLVDGSYNEKGAKIYMAELVAELLGEDKSFTGNKATQRGHELEPIHLSELEMLIDKDVNVSGLCLNDEGTAGASPDGINLVDRFGAEIKSPEAKAQSLWLWHYKQTGEMPREHRIQVHAGMVVTGLNRWYFYSNYKKKKGQKSDLKMKPLMVEVKRDGLTAVLADTLGKFLHDYEVFKKEVIRG